MVVDIIVKKTPTYSVLSLERVGAEGSDPMKREFQTLTQWAKANRVKTGKWIFYFHQLGKERYRLEACLEVFRKRKIKTSGGIKSKKLEPITVASVKFNPDQVSTRLVYSALYGWLDENENYKAAGKYSREIYFGNPWTNAWAWARAEIQVPVVKKS